MNKKSGYRLGGQPVIVQGYNLSFVKGFSNRKTGAWFILPCPWQQKTECLPGYSLRHGDENGESQMK